MSSPDDPSYRLPAWLFVLLTAVGVPPTLYLALVTQHPWQAVGLFVLYSLAIGLIWTAKVLWQAKFRDICVKAIIDLAGSITQGKCQREYKKHFHEVYGYIKVGWTSSSGRWEEDSLELKRIFVEPKIALKSQPKELQHYLLEGNSKPLVLLGEIGIGKSTLLRYIALMILNREKHLEWTLSYDLPFYLSLGQGRFIDRLKEDAELSLAEALELTLKKEGWEQAPLEWIERKLKRERCLILLDGLDEVADVHIRQQVVAWIQHCINNPDHKNRFILTSRPLSYPGNSLEGEVSVGHIERFKQVQINTFIDKWYQATSHSPSRAEELEKQLDSNSQLLALVSNPFLLTIAITVHQRRGTLPQSRVDLYKEIFEVYLTEHPRHPRRRWRWWIEAPLDNSMLPPREKRQEILQTLAYKMAERKITRSIESAAAEDLVKDFFENLPITPKEFLQNVKHNGVLVSFSESYYEFAHRSFQEYLVAMHIKDRQQPELLLSHINDSSWRETIVLYSALADPTPLIEASLKEESLLKDAIDLALILLEPEVQKHVDQQAEAKPKVDEAWKRFHRALSSAAEDKDIWREIANAQLKQRQWKLVPDGETSKEKPTIDSSFIRCLEYQLFLDQPEHGTRQPDHWQDDRFPKGQGLKPVLGMRPSDAHAFCDWLSAREKSGICRYRLPTFKESEDIRIKDVGTGYWTEDGNIYQFVWGEEGPHSSNILSSNRLYDLSVQDNSFVLRDKLKPEAYASAIIPYARELIDICSGHKKLVERLRSIGNRINERKRSLQDNHNRACEHKKELDEKIDQVERQKADYERTLEEIAILQERYNATCDKLTDLEKKREDLLQELTRLEEQLTLRQELVGYQELTRFQEELTRFQEERIKLLEADLQRGEAENLPQMQPASERRIQQSNQLQGRIVDNNPAINQNTAIIAQLMNKIVDLKRQLQEVEDDLKNATSGKSELIYRLEYADEKSANQQLESAKSKENELTQELEGALNERNKTERQLSSFRTLATEFDTICSSFSRFASARRSDALDPHKQILNLDDTLIPRDYQEALEEVCLNINRSIQELAEHLELFHRKSESDITFASIKSDIREALTSARALARQFNQATVDKYLQELARLLNYLLSKLNENRSFAGSRRTRVYIRYVAEALALYLSFADSFSGSQSVFEHHFNVYITFALLEERINRSLDASEGILIVREPTSEKHETI